MKHDLETFLLFSPTGARIITFSPPRTRSKPPSLEAFYYFPGILTDFNSLPPASLSLVLLPGGYSHTLPIRVRAALVERGRHFEAPDLERGIHFRGVF